MAALITHNHYDIPNFGLILAFLLTCQPQKGDFSDMYVNLPPILKLTGQRCMIFTRKSKLPYQTCSSTRCYLISYK